MWRKTNLVKPAGFQARLIQGKKNVFKYKKNEDIRTEEVEIFFLASKLCMAVNAKFYIK